MAERDRATGASQPHAGMANAIRVLAMDAVENAKSGHPGMPMGMADVATVLFTQFLKFDASRPAWPDRDRFVLSAGHGSMLLYALLYLTGYDGVGVDELRRFRQLGAKTAGHPEFGHCPGVETTTGPLGQGIATAVGMALAERMLNARYGDGLVDHRTYVMAGDGCLMEGISHEAIDLAGHLKLSRLIVLFDDNGITIDGGTSLSTSMDQLKRFEAAGWAVTRVNGHAPAEVADALAAAQNADRPSLIACRTIIGFGAPNKQGTKEMHGAPLGAAEIAAARAHLGWSSQPFEVPEHVLARWRAAGSRGRAMREHWQARLEAMEPATRVEFQDQISGRPASDLCAGMEEIKRRFSAERPRVATRISSQQVLTELTKLQPNLVGGSADLTGSNGTRTKDQVAVAPADYRGSYINYGVREHAMASAMNGLALHGGFIPYGGTFLAFSDYSRPAIRLAALMGVRVVHVMTHDSIGLGEDGPTHQPVEHLASLRAIPNLLVFRPADAVETAEAWAVAIRQVDKPSVLCLTRQNVPTLRTEHTDNNLVAFGAHVLIEPKSGRDVTLLATGSEVALAVEAAARLARIGMRAAVVSMPSWEMFAQQPEEYRLEVLGSAPRIAIEAGVRLGWDQWIGSKGVFIGMKGFGASAPGDEVYRHCGITADAIVAAAKAVGG
ncbi:MAG: transketolase [Hyphomicrobiaceae bacterium]|nr:MAG: transketolase [Hyphomicrobiaceae bacterium]